MIRQSSPQVDITLEELLEAGSHFGHQVRRWNPKMSHYIYGAKDGVHIFDLAKTREGLVAAFDAVKKTVENGGIVLFVGTKRQAQDLIRDAAIKVGMPHVASRWLGGTLTNFDQIKRSIEKLHEMKSTREAGGYQEYTKHERLLIDRKIDDLERKFGGISSLKGLPDMLFIVDTHQEKKAVDEARKMGVPVVGVVDTNGDPTKVEYVISANDDAVKSIALIVDFIAKAVEESKTHKQSLPLRGNEKRISKLAANAVTKE